MILTALLDFFQENDNKQKPEKLAKTNSFNWSRQKVHLRRNVKDFKMRKTCKSFCKNVNILINFASTYL